MVEVVKDDSCEHDPRMEPLTEVVILCTNLAQDDPPSDADNHNDMRQTTFLIRPRCRAELAESLDHGVYFRSLDQCRHYC